MATLPRLPNNIPVTQDTDGSVSVVQTDAVNAGLPDQLYFSVDGTITSDAAYIIPFEGRSMIFYSDKPVILRLNSQSNDGIPLMTNIGIKFDKMRINSVFVEGVSSPTSVRLIVTGK